MSYLNIRNALKTRLEAVAGVGKVHTFLRWSLDPTESPNFNTLFSDNYNNVNVWIITREEFSDAQGNEDNRTLRRHKVCVHAFYRFLDDGATKSELDFQDLLDAVEGNLRIGDRTLNNSCLTYSLPDMSKIGLAAMGNRKDSYHHCEIKLLVDEVF